jgi:hypothetical protein
MRRPRATAAPRPPLEAVDPAYAVARARRMGAEAELRRLELRRRHGELVERGLVERRVGLWARRLQDTLVRWPARIGAELAASLGVEEAALTRALEGHVRRLCRELAGERGDRDGPPPRGA